MVPAPLSVYPISPLASRYILIKIGSGAFFSSRLISFLSASSSMYVSPFYFPLDAPPNFTI